MISRNFSKFYLSEIEIHSEFSTKECHRTVRMKFYPMKSIHRYYIKICPTNRHKMLH